MNTTHSPAHGIVNGLIISAVLWLMLFALATPSHAQDSKLTKVLLYGSWAACQSFDVISTAVALRNPNIIEGNPILRGPQLYPLKIGVNIGFGFWQHKIVTQQPTSKRRLTFPLVAASTGCLAGMLNTRTIRSLR